MNMAKRFSVIFLIALLVAALTIPACAASSESTTQAADKDATAVGMKAIAVGLAIGLAAAGGAVGMGLVGGKAADGISRQPDMESKIRTTLMLDLVFIETAIIYALLVVILVIFVL